jgi:peptide/nickel transport system permease protein
VRQYSLTDYLATAIGFTGLAIPDFLLALVLMYLAWDYFGFSIGGLFSPDYVAAPWSLGRVIDLLQHMIIPIIVLGTAGTASLIRITRANLLDELRKPYVVTARAKGMSEWKLIFKYPVRLALNPIISLTAYILPFLVSGSIIVSVVLSLPTIGPVLLRSLLSQDMFLAGAIILLIGVMTVIGTMISDILLGVVDPRVRLE